MSDAFRHVPELRPRIKPADGSALRVTPEVLAAWDERARSLGREAGWRQSDEQIEASRQLLCSQGLKEEQLRAIGMSAAYVATGKKPQGALK